MDMGSLIHWGLIIAPAQESKKNIQLNFNGSNTSLGPWIFVREMDSSSQCDLIMAPGQEANGDS